MKTELEKLAERAWADFVNCQDDKYFGHRTARAKQLAVLHRFAKQVLQSQRASMEGEIARQGEAGAVRARAAMETKE